eukprot:TRINITY_DN4572_c0_g1_i1.p1 TRINITY_DN4572_c0_g1~~TRINITY_DN4572_c0_g1_i1.p1  ORF type:complete len:421 (-),score=84.89 TRINITY_DN4572_c0_g1_i1:45-1307(-)
MSTQCMDSAEEELREPVVETLIQILGKEKIPQTKATCNSDCAREPEYWCSKCELNLCGVCLDQHSQTVFTRNHQVNRLDQQKNQTIGTCPTCNVKSANYCENCQRIVCGVCVFRDHNNHKFSEVSQKVEQRKAEFQNFINQVKDQYEQTRRKKEELNEQLVKIQKELKQQTKREILFKITHEKLVLAISELGIDQLQASTLTKLEQELRGKLFGENVQREPQPTIVRNVAQATISTAQQDQTLADYLALLQKNNQDTGKTLLEACGEGYIGIVKVLIEKKVNLDQQHANGETALMRACNRGRKEIGELLIKNKANPDLAQTGNNNWTALIHGSSNGHTEIVDMLINHKSNIHLLSKNNETALTWAAYKGYKEICELLVRAKADHRIKDSYGRDALGWAQELSSRGPSFKEIVKLFETLPQ